MADPPPSLAAAEYASLRQEILERIKFQHQIQAGALLVFAAVIVAGTNRDGLELVLLVWPILAVFFAAGWSHEGIYLFLPARYIRDVLEVDHPELGWEAFVRVTRSYKSTVLHGISVWGLFLGTQLISVAMYFVVLDGLSFDPEVFVFLGLDLLSLIGTVSVYWFYTCQTTSYDAPSCPDRFAT